MKAVHLVAVLDFVIYAREEGIEIGVEKGIEIGVEKGIILTAKNCLKEGPSLETVSKLTGLDIETINSLK